MLGQIIACPNKKNNHTYEVKWIRPSDGSAWPDHLQELLVHTIPKDLIHIELATLIAQCPVNKSTEPSSRRNPAPRPSGQAPTTDSRPTIARPSSVIQTPATPAITVEAAFAAVHTAGSLSGVSSLGNSQGTTHSSQSNRINSQRQRTRLSSDNDAHDSDEDDTEAEDEYEVNFSEIFWQRRRELQEMVEEDLIDEEVGEEQDVVSCPTDALQFDYARLLKDVTDFNFEHLTLEEAREMEDPPPVYHGEHGLKRGVSNSFDTTLQAFRIAGFSEQLIERWTLNSNK